MLDQQSGTASIISKGSNGRIVFVNVENSKKHGSVLVKLKCGTAKCWCTKNRLVFFFSFFTIYSLIILFLTTILFLKINNLGLWAISKVMDRAKSKALREYNIPNSIRPTSECYVSYMDEFTKSYMAAISPLQQLKRECRDLEVHSLVIKFLIK